MLLAMCLDYSRVGTHFDQYLWTFVKLEVRAPLPQVSAMLSLESFEMGGLEVVRKACLNTDFLPGPCVLSPFPGPHTYGCVRLNYLSGKVLFLLDSGGPGLCVEGGEMVSFCFLSPPTAH